MRDWKGYTVLHSVSKQSEGMRPSGRNSPFAGRVWAIRQAERGDWEIRTEISESSTDFFSNKTSVSASIAAACRFTNRLAAACSRCNMTRASRSDSKYESAVVLRKIISTTSGTGKTKCQSRVSRCMDNSHQLRDKTAGAA